MNQYPETDLNEDMEGDSFSAARGIVNGMLLGALLWWIIAFVIVIQ